jgi:hypothetical protein
MPDGIQISKVGHTEQKTQKASRIKTFPRGILRKTARKIEGVRDPAKSPPFKPGVIRILTRKGEMLRRKKIHGTMKTLSDKQIRDRLKKSNLQISDKAPRELALSILEGGTEAGMIS